MLSLHTTVAIWIHAPFFSSQLPLSLPPSSRPLLPLAFVPVTNLCAGLSISPLFLTFTRIHSALSYTPFLLRSLKHRFPTSTLSRPPLDITPEQTVNLFSCPPSQYVILRRARKDPPSCPFFHLANFTKPILECRTPSLWLAFSFFLADTPARCCNPDFRKSPHAASTP